MSPRPPARVLAAFGVVKAIGPLDGGQGGAWASADLVLKPLDITEDELRFQADLFPTLRRADFRVVAPRRAADGSLVVDGWTCLPRLTGQHEEGRWAAIIEVGRQLHAAVRHIPEPPFIKRRTNPWSIGDRVAFGELPTDAVEGVPHLQRLLEALAPVGEPAQLIHGDLTGNVLFAQGLPPAIIDFSAYYRPEPFASAIVVADALVFEGADETLLDAVADSPNFPQYLLRALIYRLVTHRVFHPEDPPQADEADAYLPAVELAIELARSGRW